MTSELVRTTQGAATQQAERLWREHEALRREVEAAEARGRAACEAAANDASEQATAERGDCSRQQPTRPPARTTLLRIAT